MKHLYQHSLAEHPAAMGSLIGVLFFPVHLFLPHSVSIALAALLLCLIAGVYIGFAAKAERMDYFLIELANALVFTGVAICGIFINKWLIPIFYVIHAGWDMLHSREGLGDIVPKWYIPFCVYVDVLAATAITVAWLL